MNIKLPIYVEIDIESIYKTFKYKISRIHFHTTNVSYLYKIIILDNDFNVHYTILLKNEFIIIIIKKYV